MAIRTVEQAVAEAVILGAATSLRDASTHMLDAGAGAAVVVVGDAAAGLVTAEDVARALAEGRDVATTTVLDVADREPVLAGADEPLVDVHLRMRSEQRDLAIAVDRKGKALGLVEL